jgi:NAD(P)H-hydrate repair Nnr-like enzyme with NAD(P)H-hydrate dehydratase domain
MDDRKNTESGLFNRFALVAVVAIAACATGAVILLAPAAATSGSSTASAATPAAATPAAGYFPNQYVNQAKEIEPMPEMYY